MKDASQYPITFAYGAVDGYYYGPNGIIGPFHRGDDRAMPDNTPVIVNGIQIGLSNNTGASSGSHLHIGRFVGGQSTNPAGGGFEFSNAVVTEINQDSTNGKYVRLEADGASWVYLHLAEQTVSVGQTLTAQNIKPGGEKEMASQGMIDKVIKMGLHREPRADELQNTDWAADAEELVITVWGNGGEALYHSENSIPSTQPLPDLVNNVPAPPASTPTVTVALPTPTEQAKVNIFVALWKAIFG